MKCKSVMYVSAVGLISSILPAVLTAQEQEEKKAELRYGLIELQTFPKGTLSQASLLRNDGLVVGVAATADNVQHAVLWPLGLIVDIGNPGLGGPNSGAFGINAKGQVDGLAESSESDPNNENFCAYGTGFKCLPFVWQDGVMTALPLLGGNNGTVAQINSRGEVGGVAENSKRDTDCPGKAMPNGTGPQVLNFDAVIWGPKPGEIRKLRPFGKDTVAEVLWINDNGQAVGASGTCANLALPPFAAGPHAVLWEKDGSVHNLGNLGGKSNPAVVGIGNIGLAINDRGQVVGASPVSKTADHAFLWTRETGMIDLKTLKGDVHSAAQAINSAGEIVGASGSDPFHTRAFIWKNGKMIDLNTLVGSSPPLFLVDADAINDRGEIAGFGVNNAGQLEAFKAIPCDSNHVGSRACRE